MKILCYGTSHTEPFPIPRQTQQAIFCTDNPLIFAKSCLHSLNFYLEEINLQGCGFVYIFSESPKWNSRHASLFFFQLLLLAMMCFGKVLM